LLVGALSLVSVCSAAAQDSVRLRFQIVKDGFVVANPEVSVKPGSTGRIEIKDTFICAFTATVRESRLSVAFDIKTGAKQLQPQLVLGKNDPGSISWTPASGESVKIVVVAVP
jgi:hypothetical protein